MAGRISLSARREVMSAATERYRSAKRAEKGRILDALYATTGRHRKQAVRALRQHETVGAGRGRGTTRAQTQTWRDDKGRAGGSVGGVRSGVRQWLKVMIQTLLPALEQHG
jgi:hypothetical protein